MSTAPDLHPCTSCGETVFITAQRCRHCGEPLSHRIVSLHEVSRPRRPAPRPALQWTDEEEHRVRTAVVLTLLLPGLGHLYLGRSIKGNIGWLIGGVCLWMMPLLFIIRIAAVTHLLRRVARDKRRREQPYEWGLHPAMAVEGRGRM